MKFKLFSFLIHLVFLSSSAFSQSGAYITKEGFELIKKYNIAIGYISTDTLRDEKNQLIITKRFRTLGSGLLTYGKADTSTADVVITARHVIDAFLKLKIKEIYLRASWADTLRTTDYHGLQIPIFEQDGSPNIFFHPNNNIDLGGIYIPTKYYTQFFIDKTIEAGHSIFPIKKILSPNLGDQVWIYGYPDHIENNFQLKFSYCINIFKPGYVTWIPQPGLSNPDLNHITIVESNSTHGNSGGPVFSVNDGGVVLVGILVGGYEEPTTLLSKNLPVNDSTGRPYYSMVRSGVSIIEKAESILPLLSIINIELSKRLKKEGFL